LPDPAHPPQDPEAAQKLQALIDETVRGIEAMPMQRVMDYLHARMPTFVYMDDYRAFCGAAQLSEVLKRKQRGEPREEDETITIILQMAGLDLEEEVRKGNEEDREQRILDMNDASQTLTRLIADRWSQKQYEVMFQADGQHFIAFVKDADDNVLVPLEERSRGFQWFFSFDMMFMYETGGRFENAVILLDEPGLHLHAAAQRDLLKRMKAYAEKNQLVYTTHMPFMIEFTRLDNVYVAEEIPGEGTKVHQNWATADRDARFTLLAGLGLAWSQSLFLGPCNLVVEGVTDFWFLTGISTLMREAGQAGLDEQLVVTPVGGARQAAYVGALLQGQRLHVAVLLEGGPEGATAYERLVHQSMLEAKQVLRLGEVLGAAGPRALEDLFDEEPYLRHVSAAYAKDLKGRPLILSADKSRSIVQRVEEALKACGVERFNKGRVAKRVLEELARKKLADLPTNTVKDFQKVIGAINALVASWRKAS
jgi:predicted ATP-dependent endonuclease of OLD family